MVHREVPLLVSTAYQGTHPDISCVTLREMAIYVHMLSHAAVESIRTAEHRLEGSFISLKNKTMKRSVLIFFPYECEVLEKSDIFSAGTS